MKTLNQSAAKPKCFVSSPKLFEATSEKVIVLVHKVFFSSVVQLFRVSALDLCRAEGCRFESRSTWDLY